MKSPFRKARMEQGGGDPAPEPEAPMEPESQDEESPEETVNAHGEAHDVHIRHDSTGHHIESEHHDGHKHHSSHASKQEAHDAGRTLAGANDDEANGDGYDGEESESPRMSVPGL